MHAYLPVGIFHQVQVIRFVCIFHLGVSHPKKNLHLPPRHGSMEISGIGGSDSQFRSRGITKSSASSLGHVVEFLYVEAILLRMLTSDLPKHLIQFQEE